MNKYFDEKLKEWLREHNYTEYVGKDCMAAWHESAKVTVGIVLEILENNKFHSIGYDEDAIISVNAIDEIKALIKEDDK